MLPLNLDNDLYQAMGWELAAHGRLPLIGSWAHTLPGMAYLHALSILLFGNSALGFRIFDCLVHLATAVLLFVTLRRRITESAALLAATLWTLYYISEGYWLAGQLDGFALCFLVLGVDLFDRCRQHDGKVLATLSGLSMAFLTVLRPTYGLFGIVLLAMFMFRDRTEQSRHTLWYTLGACAGVVLTCAPYCFVAGGLHQLYAAAIEFNLTAYGNVRADYNWLQLIRHPLVLLAFTAAIPGRSRRCERGSVLLWVALLLCSLVSLVVMGKYLVYHFDPIFLLVSIAAALGLVRIGEFIPNSVMRRAALALVLLFFVRILYPFNLLHHIRDGYRQDKSSLLQYVQHSIKSDSLYGLQAEDDVLRFLRTPAHERGTIEYCSITPAIRWRSERNESSRFTMIHAYGLHTKTQGYTPFQIACREEFLDSLRSNKPTWIILANGPSNLPMFDYQSPSEIVKGIPGVQELLASDYTRDTLIGIHEVWRRARDY